MAPRKSTGKPTGKSIVSNLGKRLSSLAARVPVLSRPARGTRARPDAKTRSRSTSSASPVIDVRKAVRSALAPLPSVVTAPFKRAAKSSTTKPSATRTTGRKTAAHAAGRPQGKRERIDPTPGKTGGSRYVRRDSAGHFTKDQVAVGRSLAADRRSKAKTKATKGNKDRGD